jgi:RecB family endonuclease NucS
MKSATIIEETIEVPACIIAQTNVQDSIVATETVVDSTFKPVHFEVTANTGTIKLLDIDNKSNLVYDNNIEF